MTNRAILYLRSSKDRSDVSIDAQRRALHALATSRNLVVVDEFADAVESGKDDDRPAFQRLIHALKQPARAWEIVLALDTSRVARRRAIALIFEQECERRGVRVVYNNVPDVDPVTEMLLKSILQAMDEWHSLTSRQKGLAGMAENVRQGWRAGGRAPRGYRLVYHGTGAVRDGTPVMKSRLELDDDVAPQVAAYLRLRAQGIARGAAIGRLGLTWDTSSVHSLDWQALTYAGHTVWNMHAAEGSAEKRRPRAEWIIKRNTHPPMITDAEAEAVLAQMERSVAGRRVKAGGLLFSGVLVSPDGQAWHSDGCGFYKLGKGKKVAAARLDAALLGRIGDDLLDDGAVQRVLQALQGLEGEPVDGRTVEGMARRVAALTTQIGKVLDLASLMEDPAPVVRRVADLEHQRAELVKQLDEKRAARDRAAAGARITADQVRALLRRLFAEIAQPVTDGDRRAEARQALTDLVEKIELDPASLRYCVHYAVATSAGDKVASPTVVQLTPVRWQSQVYVVPTRRKKGAAAS